MALELGRRIRGQAAFGYVLAVLGFGLIFLVVAPEHWRQGIAFLAAALLLAAVLRIFVAVDKIGMLAIRGRKWDTVCYTFLGVAITAVDLRLPH